MKKKDASLALVRLSFFSALLWVALGTTGSLTADDGITQYDYPGRIAGGIAFDDDGGLWVADGVRSESTTKIYHLKDNKLIRTIDVPVKWIGSLAYGAGKLWATTGQVVQIDPATGKVLRTIDVKAPTEHTGLASDGRTMWYCYRTRLTGAGTVSRTAKGLSGLSFPRTYKAGALVFDGKGLWLLSHDYHSISRLGADNDITAEKGILIPADKKEHRLRDMDWDGKSFWISITKRTGINKYDNAIIKVETVDYKLDSEIQHAKVRINYPCEGSLVLQRTRGSQRPRRYKSFPPPEPETPKPETTGPDLETGEYYIPEGEYRVLEYAYFKTDDKNFKWRVKVLDRGTLNVKADGKVRNVQIGTGLAGKLTIKPPAGRWQQGRYSLHFAVVDSTGANVQFRRVLKTPDASFVMRDKSGRKIASGHFAAGVDSYLGYHVRIPRQAEFPLSVKLALDSSPFDVKLEEMKITELPKDKPQRENTP